MFQDFDDKPGRDEGRGRMGVSFGVSLALFGLVAVFLATAVATARAVVRRQREVSVEFAELPQAPAVEEAPPPPPPPPPPPRRRRGPRRRAHRPELGPPSEIPDEQPDESDDELVDAGDTGPVDGFLDGTEEGDGDGESAPAPAPAPPPPAPATPPPTQRRESITRPSFLSGCRAPEVPDALRHQAATVRIDVRILVGADGVPMSARMVRSHPLIPDALVLACARAERFEPARLSDGTAIPYPFMRRFVFRPSNL
ncbi:MAG: hypothetical protein GXP55_00220 [Deltaproteobacteria bacterium]|nr:hypothetical protein [Deltaproteobacteria bacterium]